MRSAMKILFLLALAYCSISAQEITFEYGKVGIFESMINKSIECVRQTLHNGIPDLDFPPLDPMRFHEFPIEFDKLNLPDVISGYIHNTNVQADRITDWKITSLKGTFKLVPPTYTVNFAMHYDSVVGQSDYEGNVTVLGHNIQGKGHLYSEVQDLVAAGHVKAVIDDAGVHIKEFSAPITVQRYIFRINGLNDDEELSERISKEISENVPKYVNEHPEIFTNYISPVLMYVFDQLVNNDAGVGIVKRMVKTCIIDVINPPNY